jgi:oligopeptide/dipeptide ABC transporter ATP-binding protein
VFTVGEQIVEAVQLHQNVGMREAYEIAEQAMNDVGIADPHKRIHEYPHRLSGGMRQRVMIAMALSCRPKLLIADEPTTALDVTIQAQILELLRKLQEEKQMAVMLITHDLGVVAENADAVAVMYASKVVEYAAVDDLFHSPKHPYTEGLFRAMPRLGKPGGRLQTIAGTVPSPRRFPSGCKFHPRCPRMNGDPLCAEKEPLLREIGPKHWASCHHIENFAAAPVTPPSTSAIKTSTEAPA